MPEILGVAEVSIRSNMELLNAISRNMANANTQGYKREIYMNQGFGAAMQVAAGTAPPVPAHATDMSAGLWRYTGSPLHLAIEGPGYFQLQSPHGVVLTRNGGFQIDRSGQLTSAQGWPV